MTSYVFDPQVMHGISRDHLGEPLEQMFDNVATAQSRAYAFSPRERDKRWRAASG